MENIAIFGASGAIGQALARAALANYPDANLYLFSRKEVPNLNKNTRSIAIDITNEESLAQAAHDFEAIFDLILVTNGVLHTDTIHPEKSLQDLSLDKFETIFAINTYGPALIAKYFLPKLLPKNRAIFAALTSRVSSMEDNSSGGWYSYRASKAALTMILKNASIEIARKNDQAIIVGLHPGTVDSPLSKPYQKGLPEGQLFTPDFSAQKLLTVIDGLTPPDSGKNIAWDGQTIPY